MKILFPLILLFLSLTFSTLYGADNITEKISLTREKLLFLAETIEKFERESGKEFVRLSQLRKYLPNIDNFKDGWKRDFIPIPKLKIIVSTGKDGVLSLNYGKLGDDLGVYWPDPSKSPKWAITKFKMEKLRDILTNYTDKFHKKIDDVHTLITSEVDLKDGWNTPFYL